MKKLFLVTLIMSIALLASCSKSNVDTPPTPILDTDVESLAFPTAGETKTLKITSNVDWEIVEIGEGITVAPLKGKGDATLSVTMPASGTYEDTPKSFKIKSTAPLKTITVTQIGMIKGLIHVAEAGTLASLLDANPSLKIETRLKITGTMNEADFLALKSATKTTLEVVDISELTITELPNYAFTELVESNYVGYPKLKTITLPAGLTSIARHAFAGCSSLKSIAIPAGVTEIGAAAFSGCSALTSITLPTGVTSIGGYAFQDCSSLTTITIPAGVTEIGGHAFSGCSALTEITIPEKVTEIGERAFYDCSSLKTITLSAEVTSIGEYAFSGCSALTEITIPEKVTEIGERAFYDCSSLKTITLSAEVTSIGEYAFNRCSALKDVTCLATAPPNLGVEAFKDIHADKTLKVPAGSVAAYKASLWISYFPEGVISGIVDIHVAEAGTLGALLDATPSLKTKPALKITGTMNGDDFLALIGATKATLETLDISDLNIIALPNKAFTELVEGKYVGYPKLKTITLPTGLTSIGNYAFLGCSALTTIAIPVGVTKIENSAFDGCSSLASITLPTGLESIGNYAFLGCTALESISIPEKVTSIGNYAFQDCTSLASITLPDGLESIEEAAFNNCKALKSIDIPEKVTKIGSGTFNGCSALTTINIPAGVTIIMGNTFYGCSSLTSIIIPKNVTSIGFGAFSDCKALTTINIPAGVTIIMGDTFYGCSSLTSIIIPKNVTSIRFGAFSDCKALTTINIPAGVTIIMGNTFYGCSALKDVTCMATTPPTLGADAFKNIHADKTLKVPAASVADYKTSSWKSYFLESVISGIADIHVATAGGLGALLDATPLLQTKPALKITGTMNEADFTALKKAVNATLEVLDITELTITALPAKAFGDNNSFGPIICTKLKTISLPTGLKSIEDNAFAGCKALTAITIPETVISIGESAFTGCSELKTVTLPAELESIGSEAFMNCSILDGITIPKKITKIEAQTFNGCKALTSIIIPDRVTVIDNFAFSSCSALTSITISAAVTSMGMMTFYGCSALKDVRCLATAPPNLGSSAFSNTHTDKTLTVPAASVATYKGNASWKSYFPESVISGL